MPVYRLTNVGRHIAGRILNPRYANAQGYINIFSPDEISILTPDIFAATTLATRLHLEIPSSPQFNIAIEIMANALNGGVINSGSDYAGTEIFHRMLAAGLFSDGAEPLEGGNPIERLRVVNFQATLNCNLTCLHCSRGRAPRDRQPLSLDILADALEQAYLDNIMRSFAVTGGEPTLYKGDLFWLFKFAATSGVLLQLVTNGWWGDKQNFKIWGRRFKTARHFTDELMSLGRMMLHFSLDGTERAHDALRQNSGSFNSVIAAIKAAREADLTININTVDHPGLGSFADVKKYLAEHCGLHPETTNMLISDLMRVGRAAKNFPVAGAIPDSAYLGGCKSFLLPKDLTVSYDGKVGTCGLTGGFGEFGSLRTQTMTEILNSIQDTAAYKLHSTGDLRPYLHLLPPDIFPEQYNHPCGFWIPLTMIATKIDQEEKRLSRKLYPQEIRAIQEYVGWRTMLGKSEHPFG